MQVSFDRLNQTIVKGFDNLSSAMNSLATSFPTLANAQTMVTNPRIPDYSGAQLLLPKSRKGPKISTNPQRRSFRSNELAVRVLTYFKIWITL